MNKQVFYVGFESANSFIKAKSNKSDNVDVYLNTLTKTNEVEYKNSLSGLNSDKVYSIDDKYYIVGKNPDGKNTSSGNAKKSRYKTEAYKHESLIAIYRQLEEHINKDLKNKIYVVTGVPTNHSTDIDVIDSIEKQLKGLHTINDTEIYIDSVDVINQGESTFYAEVLDDYGDVNTDFIEKVKNEDDDEITNLMYIDIGHGTTEFKLVTNFSSYDTLQHQETGMTKVWLELLTAAKKDFNDFAQANPTVLSTEKYFRKSGKFEYGKDKIPVDVDDLRDVLLQEYADKIIDTLYTGVFLDTQYDSIRITGGGSLCLKDHLERAIKRVEENNKNRMKKYVFLNENPEDLTDERYAQKTNAIGYLKYCININKAG